MKNKRNSTVTITFDTHTILKFIGVTIIAVLGLFAVYYTSTALILIAISFFLALALNPPVSYLASRLPHGGRGVATAISYILVLSVIGAIFYATIPPLVSQSNQLINRLPGYIEDIKNGNNDDLIGRVVERFELQDRLSELQNNLDGQQLTSAGGPVVSFVQKLSGSLISTLTVLVLTFFMLIEGPSWLAKFWRIHPKEHRKHRQELARKMYRVVTGYVNGQLLVAGIAATSALVMMSILKLFSIDIPYIIPMAAIVGVFGLIPLIGATLASVVVVLVSLFESIAAAIIMAIFFIVYQQVENNVLQPIIQSRSVELSPLTVFIAAIIGVSLGGLFGAIITIPVAASIRIYLNDWLKRHNRPTLDSEKPSKA